MIWGSGNEHKRFAIRPLFLITPHAARQAHTDRHDSEEDTPNRWLVGIRSTRCGLLWWQCRRPNEWWHAEGPIRAHQNPFAMLVSHDVDKSVSRRLATVHTGSVRARCQAVGPVCALEQCLNTMSHSAALTDIQREFQDRNCGFHKKALGLCLRNQKIYHLNCDRNQRSTRAVECSASMICNHRARASLIQL